MPNDQHMRLKSKLHENASLDKSLRAPVWLFLKQKKEK